MFHFANCRFVIALFKLKWGKQFDVVRLMYRLYSMNRGNFVTIPINTLVLIFILKYHIYKFLKSNFCYQLFKAVAGSSTSSQPDVLHSLKNSEDKKKKWDSDAPQAVLRDQLWTKIFMSTGISTQFLKNKDVREYHQTTDAKYALPG